MNPLPITPAVPAPSGPGKATTQSKSAEAGVPFVLPEEASPKGQSRQPEANASSSGGQMVEAGTLPNARVVPTANRIQNTNTTAIPADAVGQEGESASVPLPSGALTSANVEGGSVSKGAESVEEVSQVTVAKPESKVVPTGAVPMSQPVESGATISPVQKPSVDGIQQTANPEPAQPGTVQAEPAQVQGESGQAPAPRLSLIGTGAQAESAEATSAPAAAAKPLPVQASVDAAPEKPVSAEVSVAPLPASSVSAKGPVDSAAKRVAAAPNQAQQSPLAPSPQAATSGEAPVSSETTLTGQVSKELIQPTTASSQRNAPSKPVVAQTAEPVQPVALESTTTVTTESATLDTAAQALAESSGKGERPAPRARRALPVEVAPGAVETARSVMGREPGLNLHLVDGEMEASYRDIAGISSAQQLRTPMRAAKPLNLRKAVVSVGNTPRPTSNSRLAEAVTDPLRGVKESIEAEVPEVAPRQQQNHATFRDLSIRIDSPMTVGSSIDVSMHGGQRSSETLSTSQSLMGELAPVILQHLDRMRKQARSTVRFSVRMADGKMLGLRLGLRRNQLKVTFSTDSELVTRQLGRDWAWLDRLASRRGMTLETPTFENATSSTDPIRYGNQ